MTVLLNRSSPGLKSRQPDLREPRLLYEVPVKGYVPLRRTMLTVPDHEYCLPDPSWYTDFRTSWTSLPRRTGVPVIVVRVNISA
jgi:hypothetical protein